MIKINSPTRRLILTMSFLVVIVIVIVQLYYKRQNQLVDPRIVPARELYATYNDLAVTGDFDSVFKLLEEIEVIYADVGHYRNAFEQGVISNNRAAVWLTMGLNETMYDSTARDSLVKLAEDAVKTSIMIYENWENEYGHADPERCRNQIAAAFKDGLESYETEQQEKFLDQRVNEIVRSTGEIRRRLSVSYTNLGIVHRHHERYDSAAHYYTKALELWDRNLTAENNLNLLLGRPKRKRNIIQRLFPPER
jgi:tetratricopeptide (TPR) repeat protein